MTAALLVAPFGVQYVVVVALVGICANDAKSADNNAQPTVVGEGE